MKQTRLISILKSVLSTAIGFVIALATQVIVFPLFGWNPGISDNLAITGIFTVVSLIRQYGVDRLFEALHIRHPMSAAAIAVLAERRRQIETEGYTPEHDDALQTGELAYAGASYARHAGDRQNGADRLIDPLPPNIWPWDLDAWRPRDARRDLVRGAALVLAEIERLDRRRKLRKRFARGSLVVPFDSARSSNESRKISA